MSIHRLLSRSRRVHPLAAALLLAWAGSASAQSLEGSFQRTLPVNGPAQLTIRVGSGAIRVRRGPAGSVAISARLRPDTFSAADVADRIRRIEQAPPVDQSGNDVRVGFLPGDALPRRIAIFYEVAVPADTSVNALSESAGVSVADVQRGVEIRTGSGHVTVGQVTGVVTVGTKSGGIDVNGAAALAATTGSGSVEASGIAGPASARTESGSIRISQSGRGDLDAISSSGHITASGVDGGVRASTSSSGIEIDGRPAGAWHVTTTSGAIALRLAPDAAFDVDVQSSSGQVESSHPVAAGAAADKHRLQGKVRGGGPTVSARSSSGAIRLR